MVCANPRKLNTYLWYVFRFLYKLNRYSHIYLKYTTILKNLLVTIFNYLPQPFSSARWKIVMSFSTNCKISLTLKDHNRCDNSFHMYMASTIYFHRQICIYFLEIFTTLIEFVHPDVEANNTGRTISRHDKTCVAC